MAKNIKKTTEQRKKHFKGYYTLLARICNCSPFYVRQVLDSKFGQYKGKQYAERNTDLAIKIRQKAAELDKIISDSPNGPSCDPSKTPCSCCAYQSTSTCSGCSFFPGSTTTTEDT